MNKPDMKELLAKARAAKNRTQDISPKVPEPAPPEIPVTSSISDRLAALKADKTPEVLEPPKIEIPELKTISKPSTVGIMPEPVPVPVPVPVPSHTEVTTGMHGELITYNDEQQKFIDVVSSGKSAVLTGAAGTGKTTCSQGAMAALLRQGDTIPVLNAGAHKHLISGTPGIVICSYTRRAVNNIRKVQSEELKNNCVTVHKLLEYQPEYYEVYDPETGESKTTMRFEPSRNSINPLPSSIHTIIIEEASMLGTDLYEELIAALPHEVQWIFIGDIEQLPPVFGPAILGFKLNELPSIRLKQVYRQALESPIIRLAHRILSGKPIPVEEFSEWKQDGEHGSLTLHGWKKKLHPDSAIATLGAFFKRALDTGAYNIEEDMILLPFNKACGTIELNKVIANHLARGRQELTYEIMAGFIKHYFSVGDKVLYDREDAEIIEIAHNPAYTGGKVQPPSINLDYWGHNPKAAEERSHASKLYGDDIDIDILLDQVASNDERVNQASHTIVVRLLDSGNEITLKSAGEINALIHSYALTVHKAQGSEWRKVFVCFHHSHATMMQRELLYTAVTRAREELYVICEPESFTKGILSQRIKGDTIEEKAEFFKGKQRKGDKE